VNWKKILTVFEFFFYFPYCIFVTVLLQLQMPKKAFCPNKTQKER